MSYDDVVFVATCGYCGHRLGESRADVLDFSFLASRGVERPAVLGKVHAHCVLESLPSSIRFSRYGERCTTWPSDKSTARRKRVRRSGGKTVACSSFTPWS